MDRKPRYGVLEIVSITNDRALVQCIAHLDKQPFALTLQQLQDGAKQCPACYVDSRELRPNQHNHTGERIGDYVAIKNIGLSSKANAIRENARQWRKNSPFGLRHTYCQHSYWLVYCIVCRREREIRGDVLRSGKLPLCRGCLRNRGNNGKS